MKHTSFVLQLVGPQFIRSGNVLVSLLVLLAFPVVVQAQFTFATNADNTLTITSYTGGGGSPLIIPSTTNGHTITAIGTSVFSHSGSLGSVVIPDTITTIGGGAFYSCSLADITIGKGVTNIGVSALSMTLLTTVVIPDNVTTLGDGLFANNNFLANVTIGNGVGRVGYQMFYSCGKLTNVTMGSSITCVSNESFYQCASLTNVTVGAAVTNIAPYAFSQCVNTTNVILPNTLTTIGSAAFIGCTSLRSITIPASVTSIGTAPFRGCAKLSSIMVDPNSATYSSVAGVLFDRHQTTLVEFPIAQAGTYQMPNSVNVIADQAFLYCINLTNVVLSDSLTNIGSSAFSTCRKLTRIMIPDGVLNVGPSAFELCGILSSVYFGGNAPTAGGIVFSQSPSTVYYLPGTTNWDATFGGAPTLLWNPQPQAAVVQSDQFGFTISGTTNILILVEACTSQPAANWTALQTCTLTNGSIYFSDPQWTNYPARFYRIRSP